MRLIDADVLIETLNKGIESIKDKPDSLAKELAIKAGEFFIQDIQDINTTPTAYDIDKVVDKLEEIEAKYSDLSCSVNDITMMREYTAKEQTMALAIEIVKQELKEQNKC